VSVHPSPTKSLAAGDVRTFTPVAALIDTNVLVLTWATAAGVAFLSFPRKRESRSLWTDVDPRLRGGDDNSDSHLLGWAAGP
jgi:hypothetical protein